MPYFIQLHTNPGIETPARPIMVNINHIIYYTDRYIQLTHDQRYNIAETAMQITNTINALNTPQHETTDPNFYKRTDPPSS